MRIKLYRGQYAAVWTEHGKTKRVSLRTPNLEDAKRQLIDFQQRKRSSGDTVGELVEAYLTDKDKTAIRAEDLRGAWRVAKPYFAHLRPDQITRNLCRAYRDDRYADGRKPNTVRKELETVRAALNWHKRGEKAVFELPPPPPPKERFLTRGEAWRLLKACRQYPHVRAFVALSLATGARQSALLDLTWRRVDFANGIVRLPRGDADDEQRKSRAIVPMNKRARRYLRVLYAARTCDNVIEWGGHKVLSIKKGFKAACVRAKIEGVTPHTLRHTAASWLAMGGVPMFEISKYLGHSDTRVTERRYAHLSPDHLRKAAKVLDF